MNPSSATQSVLEVDGKRYRISSLRKLGERFDLKRLPYSMKILLENLMRNEDGLNITAKEIEAVASWDAHKEPDTEIAFTPARVILQDFTGVPCVVDLAAMRDAVVKLGGDATQINPVVPLELVIDHSVQVDVFGSADALEKNAQIEFQRNQERYAFLRWGQKAFSNFRVVPPSTGIVHQVNLEYLARVVMTGERNGELWAWPDTLFGTDSHTTMVNGLGILGWGVGGIEAEAAMLGQPSSMLIPQVVGVKLHGRLGEGVTATDLVLTVAQALRKLGVVGKFVEFFGDGLKHLPVADRATIGNMAPEYGATCAIFPIDAESLAYLRLSGRSEEHIHLVEAYAREQGLWHEESTPPSDYSTILDLDLASVRPSMAGPKRPQDRVALEDVKQSSHTVIQTLTTHRKPRESDIGDFANEGGAAAIGNQANDIINGGVRVEHNGSQFTLYDGSVVIAAITSCTNTSNPAVMIGAGLLARNAAARGLKAKPWVKTSLAPGSKVVTDYLEKTRLLHELEKVGFYLVGYGCTTCIGNSGPLWHEISRGIGDGDLAVASVLSGNRNFEGRIHPEVKMNYLASPPLVVAYALAGTLDLDLTREPLGTGSDGKPVFLKDIWPSNKEIADTMRGAITPEMFKQNYGEVFKGDARWNGIVAPADPVYRWSDSTYIKNPPYFDGMTMALTPLPDIHGARVLGLFGDSITTDHISPAGSIKKDSPAGRFLMSKGVEPRDFNSYGSRRGNDDVMVRGTFANIRIRNQLLNDVEGGYTVHVPSGEQMAIFDAAVKYQGEGTPLMVIAGKEYGTGSSRDWAAKGTLLLGVKAVIAESFERIHRSNLVGMGVLPLQFKDGENARSIGLDGKETYDISGLDGGKAKQVQITATAANGSKKIFTAKVLLLTPKEREFYQHGGILQYVLRQLAGHKSA
ncbi:MAG: aconitate hydratase AcnA [Dokdonella sp.]|nr:aconitate hydratase AcnA [Dokdonella sp.]